MNKDYVNQKQEGLILLLLYMIINNCNETSG